MFDHSGSFDRVNESVNTDWNRSHEEMLRNLGKVFYDPILLNAVDQEGGIIWN